MTTEFENYEQSAWTPTAPNGRHATGATPIVVTTYTGTHRKQEGNDHE
jgi:hypothetical protein